MSFQLTEREISKHYVGLERYTKLDVIGRGTYGVVYSARDKVTNKMVALKKIYLEAEDEGIPCTALREVSILKALSDHPNIVLIHEVVHENQKLYLILEHMESDLKKLMDQHDDGCLPETVVKEFMRQLLTAVSTCHAHNVIHRDLKPQNLLVCGKTLKVADFGLARHYSTAKTFTHEVATLFYRSPEILLGARHYTIAMDMWSVGCIFAELLRGKPLFEGDSEIDQLFRIFRLLGTPDEGSWPGVSAFVDYKMTFPKWERKPLNENIQQLKNHPEAMDLLTRLLHYVPAERISARQALLHPYFKSITTEVHSASLTEIETKSSQSTNHEASFPSFHEVSTSLVEVAKTVDPNEQNET